MKKVLFALLLIGTFALSGCFCEHVFGEWEITQEPTCIATGIQARTCSECGKIETADTELGEHTFGEWMVTTAATCTESGINTRTCAVCGSEEQEDSAAIGHNYKETVVSNANCTTAGKTTYTCANCNHSYEKSIPATGHNWSAATCTAAKTCLTCWIIEGNALGHNVGSDGKCTRCGTVIETWIIKDNLDDFNDPTGFKIIVAQATGTYTDGTTTINNVSATIEYHDSWLSTISFYDQNGNNLVTDLTAKDYDVKIKCPNGEILEINSYFGASANEAYGRAYISCGLSMSLDLDEALKSQSGTFNFIITNQKNPLKKYTLSLNSNSNNFGQKVKEFESLKNPR